jgi:hypothetical protein
MYLQDLPPCGARVLNNDVIIFLVALFLESKVLELMFNDSSEGASVVMRLSPSLFRMFDKNMISTEDDLKKKVA